MKKKKLNKKRIFNFFMILIAIALFAVIAYRVYQDLTAEGGKVVKHNLDIIEPYGYKLDDRDTSTYKKYFKELKENLKGEKVDEELYAKTLTKIFITDFYSLNNKLTSTDIGGLEFIHPDMIENFVLNAEETMYKTVQSDLYGERKQKLPVVSSVTIKTCEKTKYTYKGKEFEGYKIGASWEYKTDLGYEKDGSFILIKDKEKLNIVEKNKLEKTEKESSAS